MKYARFTLLPIAAVLTLLVSPAGASSISAASSAHGAKAEQSLRQQLERQRKIQIKCARFAAAKARNVRQSQRFERMCQTAGASTSSTGHGSSGPQTGGLPDNDYLDEILDLPPIFSPPVDDGMPPEDGSEGGTGDAPVQLPSLDTLPPTADVAEPGSLALLGLGLVGLGVLRRRRR